MPEHMDYVAASGGARLRPLSEHDVDRVASWLIDPRLTGWQMLAGGAMSADELRDAIAATHAIADPAFALWALDTSAGEHVGFAGWKPDLPWPGVLEISDLILAPELRGRGLGLGCARVLVDHLFTSTPAHKVIARAGVGNKPVLQCIRAVGAQLEGRLRGHLCSGKDRHDLELYGLLREEWERSCA